MSLFKYHKALSTLLQVCKSIKLNDLYSTKHWIIWSMFYQALNFENSRCTVRGINEFHISNLPIDKLVNGPAKRFSYLKQIWINFRLMYSDCPRLYQLSKLVSSDFTFNSLTVFQPSPSLLTVEVGLRNIWSRKIPFKGLLRAALSISLVFRDSLLSDSSLLKWE